MCVLGGGGGVGAKLKRLGYHYRHAISVCQSGVGQVFLDRNAIYVCQSGVGQVLSYSMCSHLIHTTAITGKQLLG